MQDVIDGSDILVGDRKLEHYHVAGFFRSREEEYRVLRDFFAGGVASGEKSVHICDPALCGDHRGRLAALGVPVEDCERLGQLELFTWEDAYLKGGRFDPESMLALVDELVTTAVAQGFPRVRLLGHMEWVLDEKPGVDRLLEYEAKVTDVLCALRQPAICVFDLNRFSDAAVDDILQTHPYAILDGRLQRNPDYVPARELLARR